MTRLTLAPGESIEVTVYDRGRVARAQLSARLTPDGTVVFTMTTSRTYRGKPVRCELRARWEE